MKGKRLFLAAQAALCILAAAALAAAAVRMYAEGSAAQAGGDLFAYMFTREKAGAAVVAAPLFFHAVLPALRASGLLGHMRAAD